MATRSVNKVILIGRLGKDAETKFSPGGMAITKFSVATNSNRKDPQTGEWKEETDWANVVLFKGENVSTYLTKGKMVYVEGRLKTRTYDDKDGKKQYITEVVTGLEGIVLLGGGGPQGAEPDGPSDYSQPVSMPRSAQQRPQPQAAADDSMGQGITDDDVPF